MADVNGDGLADLVSSGRAGDLVYINKGNTSDLLVDIQQKEGATTRIGYQATPLYTDTNGKLKNPSLPFVVNTVKSLVTNDGFGNVATTTYSYAGGKYYFNGALDRKFAGFASTTETDPFGNITKTYYHQGNTTDSANGEYDDHISKAGKPYRVEQYDSSGNLYKATINKWDRADLGNGRNFVKLAQTASLDYDGNASHKDSAQTFTYDNSGNLTQTTNWGEVNANTGTGSFSDIGSDAVTTNISYAANPSANIYLPSQETTQDQSSNKIKETRHYYDTLALGSVLKGNETRTEKWKSGSSYTATTKAYNSYGLVTQETDARNNATNYTYDSYNLYPVTITNPLSQTKSFVYNYTCGKPTSITDENSRVFTVTYDGLCRPTEEKQPDLTNPTTLVTKATYVYTDTVGNRNVKKTAYLDSSNSVDEYTYFDGFDRVIQKRKEAEASNTFVVSDLVYDTRGLLQKESLPYFSSSAARTSPTGVNALYSIYTYDPLKRVIVTATAVGNTTNVYDDWKVTTTDAKGNVKDFTKDAFGNLVQVVEHNGSNYTTNYAYDRLGNLTNITDALGNVRAFTYDGLGRRLTAQDLHTSGDGTFGSYSYTYDDANNMTQRIDPKNQTVNWTYDQLNRPLTENFTGAAGTEITYAYDSGTDGKTRLIQAVALGSATTTYAYNPLGQTKSETKTIAGTAYTTQYDYDRAGNQTLITYPDLAQAKHMFNTAGLLETVQKKENGEGSFSNVVTNYDYAPTGAPTTIAYANGVTTTNTYDPNALYRTTSKVAVLPNASYAQDLAYTYDAIGNITRVVDNSNTLTKKTSDYTYDNLSRLLSATITNASSSNYTQTFSYDALGNMLTGPLGTYSYSGNGYANPHAVTSIATSTGSGGASTSTPTLVQSTIGTDGYVTLPSAVTSGNLIAVGLTAYGETTPLAVSITDNKGNTYTKATEADSNNDHVLIFYAKNVTGGSNFTVDSNIGGTISVHEYSGIATTSTLDKNNKKIGTGTAVSSNTVTTTQDNELYFGVAWSMTHNDTWTAGNGYTKREQELENETVERHVTEDKVGAAQTTTATFTTGTNSAYSAAVATFKPGTTSGTQATTTLRFVTTDQLSGANIVTDQSGNIVETLDYYPYGTIRTDAKAGSYVGEKRKYIGQEYDTQTQLSYLNARYYDASKSKFMSQDLVFLSLGDSQKIQSLVGQTQNQILSDPQQLNSYNYGRNNPIRFKDPSGLWIESGFDVAMLGLSIRQFYNEPSWTNAGGVALDTGSLLLPGVPAIGGMALRTGNVAENAASLISKNREAGIAFEKAGGYVKNNERIPSISNTANYRIPDILDHTKK